MTLERGFVDIIDRGDWNARIKSGEALRVKFGIDPTNVNVHLGHCVPLRKLREFQDAGHKIILIIGTATATMGDPSGRDKTRESLGLDVVIQNAHTYLRQIGKIINLKNTQVEYNHHFLDHWSLLFLMGQVTAQQILHRADFARRMEADQPITLKEMAYPLVQAWDSVTMHADVEIGGTEQLFNLQLGRELQSKLGQPPQVACTLPLLRGLDGVQKMGKSLNNYIGVEEPPFEMYSKVMSIPDIIMPEWYALLTDRDPVFLPESMFTLKHQLAFDIVTMLHNINLAIDAKAAWTKQFSDRQDPENPMEAQVGPGEHMVIDLLRAVGFAKSKNDARRLIEGNCVSLGDRDAKISDPNCRVIVKDGMVLRAGNRRICRICVTE
jgi:tyrosyl-tRNA synthetase